MQFIYCSMFVFSSIDTDAAVAAAAVSHIRKYTHLHKSVYVHFLLSHYIFTSNKMPFYCIKSDH